MAAGIPVRRARCVAHAGEGVDVVMGGSKAAAREPQGAANARAELRAGGPRASGHLGMKTVFSRLRKPTRPSVKRTGKYAVPSNSGLTLSPLKAVYVGLSRSEP